MDDETKFATFSEILICFRMNLWKLKMGAVLLGLCLCGSTASAQDLKSILTGVAKAVAGDKLTTAQSVVGTWDYVGPDCRFESDKLLAKAGGEAAAGQVEKKLEPIYAKFGLENASFTFGADSTFACAGAKRTINGTYAFDPEAKTITLKSKLGLSLRAEVTVVGTSMSLVFHADKLLTALKMLTDMTAQVNSKAAAISSLAQNYDGLLLGFELKRR